MMNLSNTKNFKSLFTAIYFAFMAVYLIIRDVTPLYFLIKSPIMSVLVFVFGFLLIVWDLITEANCIKGKPTDFFAAFIIICAISSIVNYKYGIAGNIKCIGAMLLQYFVFFTVGSGKEKTKILKVIFNTLIITMFILISFSVLMYFFSIDYSVVTSQSVTLDQGFDTTWGRLWGIFYDPNAISYISLVSFFASFYMMYCYKKVWAYILYSINALSQMIFIMLSVSRSALLIMIAIPIFSALYPFLTFFKKDIKKALCSVLITVAISGSLFGIYQGLNFTIPYVKSGILKSVGHDGREAVVTAFDNFYLSTGTEILNIGNNHFVLGGDGFSTDVEEIERKDEKDDYSNGRLDRWYGGIQVFKTAPILGTSPRNTVAIAKERTPDTVMGKYGWITHCSYLEVLVNTGILGTIALFGAFIYIAIAFIKSALKKQFDLSTYTVFLTFLIVAAGVFFISDVFFVFTLNSLLFLYLLGYLYGDSEHSENSVLLGIFDRLKRRFIK